MSYLFVFALAVMIALCTSICDAVCLISFLLCALTFAFAFAFAFHRLHPIHHYLRQHFRSAFALVFAFLNRGACAHRRSLIHSYSTLQPFPGCVSYFSDFYALLRILSYSTSFWRSPGELPFVFALWRSNIH